MDMTHCRQARHETDAAIAVGYWFDRRSKADTSGGDQEYREAFGIDKAIVQRDRRRIL